jgi:hypothetical protein
VCYCSISSGTLDAPLIPLEFWPECLAICLAGSRSHTCYAKHFPLISEYARWHKPVSCLPPESCWQGTTWTLINRNAWKTAVIYDAKYFIADLRLWWWGNVDIHSVVGWWGRVEVDWVVSVSEEHVYLIFRLEVNPEGGGSRVLEMLTLPNYTRHLPKMRFFSLIRCYLGLWWKNAGRRRER